MTCRTFKLADGTVGVICHTSYSQRLEDAEARHKRGERQAYCPACQKWVWPDRCSHKGDKYYTMRALREAVKQGIISGQEGK